MFKLTIKEHFEIDSPLIKPKFYSLDSIEVMKICCRIRRINTANGYSFIFTALQPTVGPSTSPGG